MAVRGERPCARGDLVSRDRTKGRSRTGMEVLIEAGLGASAKSPDLAYAGEPRTVRVRSVGVSVSCGLRRG